MSTLILIVVSAIIIAIAAIPYFKNSGSVRPACGNWRDVLVKRTETRHGHPRKYNEGKIAA